jgi:hypothetical protein
MRSRRDVRSIGAALAILVCASAAQAGVTQWSAWWIDNSPMDMSATGWSFNWGTETWNVWERYIAPDVDSSITGCSGFADVDPIIHIVKSITNGSTFDWYGYHVGVTGTAGVSLVAGSATSNVFGTIIYGPGTIDFAAPLSLPIGYTVTIAFDILVPAGAFGFDISQTPSEIPEPAAGLLLALAGVLIRRR